MFQQPLIFFVKCRANLQYWIMEMDTHIFAFAYIRNHMLELNM